MASFKERYENLNKAQKEAVDAIDGPVLVVAGPGSGKTELLSLRVANILDKTDVSPGNILCLTFTDSAAENMRSRLAGLIGRDAYRVAIHTFHSLGKLAIERFPEYFHGGFKFSPADDVARRDLLLNIFEDLPHDSPIRSFHPEFGFAYLLDAERSIQDLKRAGLTPSEFREFLKENEKELRAVEKMLEPVLEERMSKKLIPRFEEIARKLEASKDGRKEKGHLFTSLAHAVAETLLLAIKECEKQDASAPLSEWKERYIKKDDSGKRVLRDALNMPKLYALADVYEKYTAALYKEGYYDFDDMLLSTVEVLSKSPAVAYELQEQYQYILVDEFQDTNGVQMRLINLLTNAPVHEGRPNIMAVGDDDQAIYKFQGAELSNILAFKDIYKDPKIVVLTHNYRSTQKILDLARGIVTGGATRLETMLPELNKLLVASNPALPAGEVIGKMFPTDIHECHFVAKEIKRLIDSGVSPGEIAIISRTHSLLGDIIPCLHKEGVPVYYERQRNVFEERHIRELIVMARFVHSLLKKDTEASEHLLPEILSFEFFGIPRVEVWSISVRAHKEDKPWLSIMLESPDPKSKRLAEFFINLAAEAVTEPLQYVLDRLIGSHIEIFEEDDEMREEELKEEKYISPFRSFYFGKDVFERNKPAYLSFLSALRVFVESLREYKQGKEARLEDLVEYVEMREKSSLPLVDESPFVGSVHAVRLLTAHKAKGLEFEYVFVISCQDEVWAGRGMPSKLAFPQNLPISPAGDTVDDKIRLFYVAITRAKHTLYLTGYKADSRGSESAPLRFLLKNEGGDGGFTFTEEEGGDPAMVLSHVTERGEIKPHEDERALLETLVAEYKMSVTHLNNFLDLTRGGPAFFIEQNLLYFPQAKNPTGSYGSAMHGAFDRIFSYLRREGRVPALKEAIAWFEELLKRERLSAKDYKTFRGKGETALTRYFEERQTYFDPRYRIEVNFANQGVVMDGAHLTGKIDKLLIKDGTATVHDLKTGRPVLNWESRDPYEALKLYRYKNQLVFYKILVERSHDYGKHTVKRGVLEYLEPLRGKLHELALDIADDDRKRMEALIEAVNKKIISLDFPDVSGYEKTIGGIKKFEEDLIEGKI